MTRIWWIWPEHSKVSKYIMIHLKKYRVILHGTEEWWKFEEKLSYGLENDEEFSKF